MRHRVGPHRHGDDEGARALVELREEPQDVAVHTGSKAAACDGDHARRVHLSPHQVGDHDRIGIIGRAPEAGAVAEHEDVGIARDDRATGPLDLHEMLLDSTLLEVPQLSSNLQRH